jgi:hypothetical protein
VGKEVHVEVEAQVEVILLNMYGCDMLGVARGCRGWRVEG